MEEIRSAMEEHMNQMADLIENFSAELRSGLGPAYDNFIGFFHAIDWKGVVGLERHFTYNKAIFWYALTNLWPVILALQYSMATMEPWLMCLLGFHFILLLTFILTRKHVNFQMCLFLLALSGVYLAERLNRFLGNHWESFASQNYFDPVGLFFSVLWSGPLLILAMLILVNTLFSLCHLIVRWKRVELRHRAKLSQKKAD